METSNQTEDSSTPYGYDEPPQQGQEQGQESPPEGDASWGWQPKPPVTRATASFEYPEQQQEEQPPDYAAPHPQPLSFPLPEPAQPQHFYSPKVQPIQRPQPTATQPLEQAPAPQPVPSPPTPTQRVPQPAPASVGNAPAPRRRAILQDESEKAEDLGLTGRAATSYMVSGVRHANKRRTGSLFKLLGLLFLVNLLIIGVCGALLYNYFVTQVEARMADFASKPQSNGSLPTARSPLAAGTGGATAVEIKQLQEDFDKRFSDVRAQLQAAQSRITEFESAQQQQQTRVSALASQMGHGGDAAASTPASEGSAAAAPGVEAEIAPSANDLILLKERNRLTGYADEAIATGAREPYERLWEALEDPRLITLIHGARSEILRVQNFYLSGSRIESYTIQVGDYFPDNASLKDSQLRDEQLIELLEKKENPWQVRMKAANLLGLRRSRAVGDALVRAVKYDPNLDVVKEATFSFEQMSGYRARIFEPASMDAWWTQYNASPGSAATAKNTTAAADSSSENDTPPKKKSPPQAIPVPSPAPVKEAQPELRLPEWDEEQEARERANKAVSDQQKAREKKDAEKQAAAKAASDEKAPDKKKKSE